MGGCVGVGVRAAISVPSVYVFEHTYCGEKISACAHKFLCARHAIQPPHEILCQNTRPNAGCKRASASTKSIAKMHAYFAQAIAELVEAEGTVAVVVEHL